MAEGKLNPREQARLEEKKKSRKTRNRFILIGVAILLMVALVLFVNSRLFLDGLAAVKVGDTKYTVADVNYEYQKSYMQFTQTYSSYLSMFLDTSKPLSEQECVFNSDGGTWDDYFKDMAESTLVENTGLLSAAKTAGYELTDEDREEIDSIISNYAMYGTYYGYPDVDGYLAASFGAGNNEKTVRRHMESEMIIQRYLSELYDGFEYTDAQKDAYYAEHADSMDKVNCLYSFITDDDAQEKADAVLEGMEDGSEDAFRASVLKVLEKEATSTSYSVTSFKSQYGDSVDEEKIVPGTYFTHKTDSGVYVLYITGLDDNQYHTVSVRHILVKAEDSDGDGAYSDAEKEAAYNKLKLIEVEWMAGEATEESFAALAQAKSEDDGSKDNGGLYEGIYKGQMVSEFNDFCFADHKKGDTGVVYGESTSYAGYHLIYFIGADGELYSRVMADQEMRSEDYNKAYSEAIEGLTAERTAMWRYVMKG